MPKTIDTDQILNPVMKLNPLAVYEEGIYSAGDLAKIATAMVQAGQDMLAQLRSDVEIPEGEKSVLIDGVEFKHRTGYSYRGLDSAVVKKLYPFEKYPEYYAEKETVVTPTISISIKE